MPSMILSDMVSSVIPLVVIKKILSLLNGIEKYPILFEGHSALFSGYFNGGVSMIFIAFMIIWVNFVSCHFRSPKIYELQYEKIFDSVALGSENGLPVHGQK